VLARRHHPDVAGERHTAVMSRINAAFDRLRDPSRRAAYDDELDGAARAAGRPRHPRRGHAPPSVPGQRSDGRFAWAPERDGTGGAGPPPGRPSGSVLAFGRHVGWSIGEIARVDPGYLQWLEDRREGRPYLDEIDRALRRVGYRNGPGAEDRGTGGFSRRGFRSR
jgi:curved DNA-binding protein CbpA